MRFTSLKPIPREKSMMSASGRSTPRTTEPPPTLSLELRKLPGQSMRLTISKGNGSPFILESSDGTRILQNALAQIAQWRTDLAIEEFSSIASTQSSPKPSLGYLSQLSHSLHSVEQNNLKINVLGQKSCSKSTTPLFFRCLHNSLKSMQKFMPLFAYQFHTLTNLSYLGDLRPHQCPGETAEL